MNKIDTIKLDNGLTIYFYLDKRKHTTFVNLITKYGGIVKDFIMDGKSYHIPDGTAHLLEHFVVESNSIGEYTKILGQKHMTTNASTSNHVTSFYFETAQELDYGLDILLKSCYSPVFNKTNLEKIKKPIYQEIRMYEDNKFYKFNKTCMNSIFNKNKYRSIPGSIEDVKNVKIDLLKNIYKAFYQPKNQMLIVAGNFDKKHILNMIKKIYDSLDIENHETTILNEEEPNKVARKKEIVKLPTAQNYAEITYKIEMSSFSDEERLKLDFYLNYYFKMAFSVTSKYYKKQLEKRVISSPLDIDKEQINNFMLISFGNYTDNINALIRSIKKEIKQKKGLNKEKFELFKKESIAEIAVRPENIHSFINPFISNVIYFNIERIDTVEYIKSFNYDDFVYLINKIDFKNFAITLMENK